MDPRLLDQVYVRQLNLVRSRIRLFQEGSIKKAEVIGVENPLVHDCLGRYYNHHHHQQEHP